MEPPTVAETSEAEISSTAEEPPEGSTLTEIEDMEPPNVAETSEAEISSTAEEPPEGSTLREIEDVEQPTVAETSEAEIPRTAEEPPEGSKLTEIEDMEPPTVAETSEAEISSTAEEPPEGSTLTEIKDSDAACPLPSVKKYGLNLPLVNYTDSDEPQSPSSNPESEHCLSEQDHISVPRLRRTKSILMKNQIHFDSEELYDTTSADSEEEYIPKTSEDSDDSGRSEVLEVEDPLFKIKDVIKDFPPLTQRSEASSQQVVTRGRSPVRRSSSGLMHKRQCYRSVVHHSTLVSHADSSNQSFVADADALSQNSVVNLDQDQDECLPDSSSSILTNDNESGGPLSIPAVCKKENGSRLYNKKQYCLYCKLGVIKIARHLERAHIDKSEVAQAFAFKKGSKERRMHLELLRNRGNFSHNVEVLHSGVGNLVPRKQPRQDSSAQDFLHCAYCQGFFARKLLWRHMQICKLRPSVPHKPGKTRVQALCAFTTPPPPGVKQDLWKLLNNMLQDEVFSAVKSDACILEYGDHLYNRLGHDPGKHEYIRQKLRELGRLLLCSRKNTSMKTIRDHIRPSNFMQVIQAVKEVAGFDSATNTYKCPSLALKIGHSLTKVSMLVESRANVQNNYSAAKDARTFRRVYETRWNEMVSAASLRTLQEARWNTPLLLPFTKDVQTLHSYLDEKQQHYSSKLSTETSPQTWSQLTKVTLTQVILFNRRRAGEVSKMPMTAYLSNSTSDPQDDVIDALSPVEKKLCQHFRRIEIRGKRGRKVPVLLTPAMQHALDLLTSKRQECGVPKENRYLFARPSAFTCLRGSDCLRHFAKICGAKSPESLTSTKLRKQTGTLSQVLNLSNTELDQLADFLGHDIRVHRQFYRLPEGTLQLAKISKVLLALEKGRLGEFKGKTLDDINIDPEGSKLTSSQREEDAPSDVNHDDASPQQSTTAPQNTKQQGSPKTERGKFSETARQPVKKRPWEREEILAVEKHMMSFITTCRVPGKRDCDKCIEQEKEALKNRNWLAIKFYIKNRITALKRKV
ncbi:hypothetical protein F2P79_020338 [Xyrichtys novacula]|uniref:Uncharacterized protein n=1 Tax=Xyrichtys novacula TaxID=13765 RepID=A0AAV1GLG4_XYRNO|nr:hypothetical protein F2P79_020338 [Xyrichtys novacula]